MEAHVVETRSGKHGGTLEQSLWTLCLLICTSSSAFLARTSTFESQSWAQQIPTARAIAAVWAWDTSYQVCGMYLQIRGMLSRTMHNHATMYTHLFLWKQRLESMRWVLGAPSMTRIILASSQLHAQQK